FSPDGTLLAVGDTDGDETGQYWAIVKLVDIASGDSLASMTSMHSSRITDVQFSPDGSLVAASSSANADSSGCYPDAEQDLQVWNVKDAIRKQKVPFTDELFSLPLYGYNFAFSTDGIVFSNPPQGVTIGSALGGKAGRTFPSYRPVEILAYNKTLLAAVAL